MNVFDTMEAVLRETMSTGAGRNVPLETSICTTLAKVDQNMYYIYRSEAIF